MVQKMPMRSIKDSVAAASRSLIPLGVSELLAVVTVTWSQLWRCWDDKSIKYSVPDLCFWRLVSLSVDFCIAYTDIADFSRKSQVDFTTNTSTWQELFPWKDCALRHKKSILPGLCSPMRWETLICTSQHLVLHRGPKTLQYLHFWIRDIMV